MSMWATVSRYGWDKRKQKAFICLAIDEETARAICNAYGYVLLSREDENQEWKEA